MERSTTLSNEEYMRERRWTGWHTSSSVNSCCRIRSRASLRFFSAMTTSSGTSGSCLKLKKIGAVQRVSVNTQQGVQKKRNQAATQKTITHLGRQLAGRGTIKVLRPKNCDSCVSRLSRIISCFVQPSGREKRKGQRLERE